MKKLNKPVTLTIHTEDALVALYHLLNWQETCYRAIRSGNGRCAIDKQFPAGFTHPLILNAKGGCDSLWTQVKDTADGLHVNPETWTRDTPIRLGDYEVQFQSDGGVKVGGVLVSSDMLDKIHTKAREEKMKSNLKDGRALNMG